MIPVAVFVKTPGLSEVKTRLAQTVGKEKAVSVYRLCCRWTQELLEQARTHSKLLPIWAVAEEEGMGHPLWSRWDRVCQSGSTLGERLHSVYEPLQKKYGAAMVLGADSPELVPELLGEAVKILSSGSEVKMVLGKTHDGGFYLFGGNCAISKKVWTSIPYSESSTSKALEAQLESLGKIEPLPLCADIDYFEDLISVMTRLKTSSPGKYSSLLALELI